MSNASDDKKVKEAKKSNKETRDIELNDLKVVLGTESGRRAIWRILERCGIYRSSFTGNSQTFMLEGERNIGLFLLTEIEEADQDAMFKMMKEAKTGKSNA